MRILKTSLYVTTVCTKRFRAEGREVALRLTKRRVATTKSRAKGIPAGVTSPTTTRVARITNALSSAATSTLRCGDDAEAQTDVRPAGIALRATPTWEKQEIPVASPNELHAIQTERGSWFAAMADCSKSAAAAARKHAILPERTAARPATATSRMKEISVPRQASNHAALIASLY